MRAGMADCRVCLQKTGGLGRSTAERSSRKVPYKVGCKVACKVPDKVSEIGGQGAVIGLERIRALVTV